MHIASSSTESQIAGDRRASVVSVAEVAEDGMEQKAAEEFETDPRRLIARQKQIEYGKATIGYQLYLAAVPREQRKIFGKAMHPRTPDVTQKSSKRAWDGMVKAWRRSLHKYDTVNSHLSKGSTADASTAEAVREVLFVTTTTEPIPPGSPFSAPPGIGNTAMVDEPHCRTTDNPSPKDAPPSSRKGSFGCDKDQASVRSTSFTVRSTFNASAIKTAPKRAPLRDSTNGQDGGNQQWIPMRTKPANNTASKSKSDQSTKYPGHSFPFSHAPGSVYSPAEHESGGMAYRRPSSRSALISGLGASVRSAASDDLPFPSDTAKNTLASTQHKHFDSSTRPAAMARPYQPPHHRHASRLVTQLIAPSARAPDQHKTTIGTDKLPAHVAMMIHRRNAAYAAAAAAATASSITVVPARSTPQATLSCNGKCLVCKEAESTVLLLPCKHWSLCHGCSDQYLLTMDCSPEGPACTSLGQCPACLEHVKQHVSRLLAC